jgi:hypothetical protein
VLRCHGRVVWCRVVQEEWGAKADSNSAFADLGDEDYEDYELAQAAAAALDRVARFLGGKAVLRTAAPLLMRALADADWGCRRGALLGLALLAEGCRCVRSTGRWGGGHGQGPRSESALGLLQWRD